MNEISLWLLFVLLLALSAYLAGAESGMMSINRYRLKHLAKQQRSARRVYRLLKRPQRLIGTFLVGSSLVKTFTAMVAALIAIRLYGEGAVVIAGLLLTIVTVIFSEMVPRAIATRYPERIALHAGYIVKPLLKLLHPMVRLANLVAGFLLKRLDAEPDNVPSNPSRRGEPGSAESGADSGGLGHQGMLINILDLERVTVNDIMVPRNEIIGLNLDDSIEALVDQIVSADYTWLPLYEGDVSNILGFLHLRKVNRLLRRGEASLSKESLKRFAREPYFIPESTPLQVQLANFQANGQRIALVVDEYGALQGLLTLEDILEEIVGKFTTDYADSERDIVANPDRSYTIDASMNIRDVNKAIRWQLPTDGPRTLNGLLLEKLEHIPEGKVCLQLSEYRFEVLSLSDKMIDSVLARQLPQRRSHSEQKD